MKQRTDEWQNVDADSLNYHLSQWENPKQATLAFELFIRESMATSATVIDLACGTGATTAYLAERNRQTRFIGIDYSNELISIANRISNERAIPNLTFETGDWFNLDSRNNVDGVVSLQTLSWLPEYETPLVELFEKINPRWVALTSLFFSGDISCRIEVEEHARNNQRSYYNVYSIPAVSRFSESCGYRLTRSQFFEMNIDIPRPNNVDLMGTYTMRVADIDQHATKRIQISGPLLLNWYLIFMERI